MRSAVIVGIGEMGAVFARALLHVGVAVVPVIRTTDPHQIAAEMPLPDLALVAVTEDVLDPVLTSLPEEWSGRVGLIQNELLPYVWLDHGIVEPTVAAVWFEKKRGQDVKVIRPTPIAGQAASLLVDALDSIGIPAAEIPPSELPDALVVKNLYILTANIAGLEAGGTVGALLGAHEALTWGVANDVLDIQEHLLGGPVDREGSLRAMADAFAAEPEHKATGRSAPRRLQRAVAAADAAGLAVPALRAIAGAISSSDAVIV